MISFDSINFQWETQGNTKRLIIMVKDVENTPLEKRAEIENKIEDKLKEVFNK